MLLSEWKQKETRYYTELRRALHQNAECGFDLPITRGIITDELKRLQIEYKIIGKGSIAARLGRGDHAILLRADMDALFMEERSGLAFAATGVRMHACGHDMHVAMLLYALALLKEEEDSLAHEVRVLFQAGEEILQGAADAIASGILDPW